MAPCCYSPVPIVPGPDLNPNFSADLAYFADGTNSERPVVLRRPTLTLELQQTLFRPSTQITLTGGIAVRDGLKPHLAFDQAVAWAPWGSA